MPIQLLHLPVSDVHLCHINKKPTKLFKPQVMVLLTELTQNQKKHFELSLLPQGTTMHTVFCFAPQHENIAGNPSCCTLKKASLKWKVKLYPSHWLTPWGMLFSSIDSNFPPCHIFQNRKTCQFQSQFSVRRIWSASFLTDLPTFLLVRKGKHHHGVADIARAVGKAILMRCR